MEDQILKNMGVLIAGFFTVFTIVISGLGWFIRNSITTKYNKSINSIEKKHQEILMIHEHKHQISKETYEDVFKKRIKIYVDLSTLISNYENEAIKPSLSELMDRYNDYFGKRMLNKSEHPSLSEVTIAEYEQGKLNIVEDIRKLILFNQVYISQNLWESFQQLNYDFITYLNEKELIDIYFLNEENYIRHQAEVELLVDKHHSKLEKSINKLFIEIESDLNSLRSAISFK